MALKIVGRSPRLSVSERRATAMQAKGVTLRCEDCEHTFGVVFPYEHTVEIRQRLIREASEEHRRVCTKGDAEQRRKYDIWYPRA